MCVLLSKPFFLYHSFIVYLLFLNKESWRVLEPVPAVEGEDVPSPWTRCHFIAGATQQNKQPFTFTLSATAGFTMCSAGFWFWQRRDEHSLCSLESGFKTCDLPAVKEQRSILQHSFIIKYRFSIKDASGVKTSCKCLSLNFIHFIKLHL